MDASSSLLALPNTPASGLQIFAIFVNFFFPAVALVVVSIRVAGRVATSNLAIDDWLVCIAMLMSVAETIISYFFIKTALIGLPPTSPPSLPTTQALIWSYAVQILYNPILSLVKSSVLIFLSRLFGQKDRIRKFLLYLNIVNLSQMVAVFFAIVLQCLPIQFNWDFSVAARGKCVDRRALYTATAALNIAMDLGIMSVPVKVFWGLKIGKRKKAGLVGVFLLGGLVTITSIVRLIFLIGGLYGVRVINDPTRNIGFVTSGIEVNLAIITASAPALRPIFRRRENGGWFGSRSRVGTARDVDLEEGNNKPVGWDESQDGAPASRGGKGSRRGGRGGNAASKRGGRRTAQQIKSGRGGGKLKPIIRIRTDVPAELRSQSPRTSEEETMTNNGIRRVSEIQREVDGIVKEIGAAGRGTYISGVVGGGVTPPIRPSMETIRVGAVVERPWPARDGSGRPATRDGGNGARPPPSRDGAGGRQFYPAERYYSESIYPDPLPDSVPGEKQLDLRIRDEERRYNEDRVSRRYGVVTPREGRTPTTATSRGWDEGSGRPF